MNKNTNQKELEIIVIDQIDKKKLENKKAVDRHKKVIWINPPPEDGRCECCGRHINELKPFGGPGNPLVGDFKGAILVKGFRYDFPEVENPFDISDCLEKNGSLDENKFIKKYGEKELSRYILIESMEGQVSPSWECRDCIVLDTKEHYERLEKALEERKKRHERNNLSSTK